MSTEKFNVLIFESLFPVMSLLVMNVAIAAFAAGVSLLIVFRGRKRPRLHAEAAIAAKARCH